MKRPNTALLLGIIANTLGGSSYLGQKLALTGFPPGMVVALRMAISLPLLFAFAPKGWAKDAGRDDWIRMAFIGVFGLAAPHLVGVHGLRETETLNAALLIGLEPVAIVLFSALFLREKISGKQAIGMCAAIAGATLVVSKGELTKIGVDPASRGNLLLALAAVLWAIYTVGAKPTLARVSPLGFTAATSAISLCVLVPAAALELPSVDWNRALTPVPILAVLGLAIFISFLHSVLWNTSLRGIRASQMAALIFLQPITGCLIGLLIGEPMPAATIIGGLLVFAGIYFTHSAEETRDETSN